MNENKITLTDSQLEYILDAIAFAVDNGFLDDREDGDKLEEIQVELDDKLRFG